MKSLTASFLVAAALCCGAAQAQGQAQGQTQPAASNEPQYLSHDEITKLIKADPSGLYSQAMLSRAGGLVMITTREKSGEGESHDNWNDFIIVQEGEAKFTLGGSLTGVRDVAPGEKRSTGITGGKVVTLRPGDYIFAPANTAHRMELAPGGKIRYIVFKTRK